VRRLQLRKHLFPRVPIAIVQPAGDYSPPRSNAGKKLGACRSDAAMVTNLEQRALKALLGKHALLNRSLRVTLEKHRGRTVRDVQYQGIIVARFRARLVVRKWREHVDLCATQIRAVSRPHRTHLNAQQMCFIEQGSVGCDRRIISHPQLIRPEIAQQAGQTAHVVRVRMAQRNHIKMANPAGSKRR